MRDYYCFLVLESGKPSQHIRDGMVKINLHRMPSFLLASLTRDAASKLTFVR
jgi:hypothetical protein